MSPSKATEQLAQIRKAIDNVDNDIIQLIAERMILSLNVGLIKHQEGLVISHPEREQQILQSLANKTNKFNGLVDPQLLINIYQQIISSSVNLQEELTQQLTKQDLTVDFHLNQEPQEVANDEHVINTSETLLPNLPNIECKQQYSNNLVIKFNTDSYSPRVVATNSEEQISSDSCTQVTTTNRNNKSNSLTLQELISELLAATKK